MSREVIANNRTLENGIIKGVEPNSTPKAIKNSPQYTTLELFVQVLYDNIADVRSSKIINLIEHYKK
ncbi:MAG: hypothetical protein VZR09_09150 [Candidatus Gastranaerophilaceae bacterium]|nr:hypothetical protein [Candidatus Gastranaerophilaceae bacterium]